MWSGGGRSGLWRGMSNWGTLGDGTCASVEAYSGAQRGGRAGGEDWVRKAMGKGTVMRNLTGRGCRHGPRAWH